VRWRDDTGDNELIEQKTWLLSNPKNDVGDERSSINVAAQFLKWRADLPDLLVFFEP